MLSRLIPVSFATGVLLLLIPHLARSGARGDDFQLIFLEERMIQQIDPSSNSLHSWRLINDTDETATFTCTEFGEMPQDWFGFLCAGDVCVFDSTDVELQPGETESLSVKVFPLGQPGAGYRTLRVRSHDATPDTVEIDFTVLAGVTTLIVEDDGPGMYTSYYRTAADQAGLLNGVWDTDLEPLLPADIAASEHVIWYTGDLASALLEDEKQAIAAYLDGGGRLLLTGQNIAESLDGEPFLRNVLHATLSTPDVPSTYVEGVSGDPVGDGLAFDITGGDGAANQDSPDGLNAFGDGARASLRYGTQEGAAVSFENNVHRIIFLGFGFEGIDTAANRQTLFDRILDWWASEPPSAAGEAPPGAGVRFRAGPTPFSRDRPVVLEWQGDPEPTRWSVAWFDSRGRRVSWTSGRSSAGRIRHAWDGMSGAGFALESGVYFYRFSAQGRTVTGRAVYLAP